MILQSIPQELLQSISDTLNVMIPKVDQIAEASDPAISKWSMTFSAVAAATGIFGALFGYLGFIWSKKTAKNVSRTNPEIQINLCTNLIRSTYRLVVRTRAIAAFPELQKSTNLFADLSIPAFEDYFILADYRNNADQHESLVNLKYEIQECNAALSLCQQHLNDEGDLSQRDKDNLLERPVDVLISFYKISDILTSDKEAKYKTSEMIISMITRHHYNHIKNLQDSLNHINTWIHDFESLYKKLTDKEIVDKGNERISRLIKIMKSIPQELNHTIREIISTMHPFLSYPAMKQYAELGERILSAETIPYDEITDFVRTFISMDAAIEKMQIINAHY